MNYTTPMSVNRDNTKQLLARDYEFNLGQVVKVKFCNTQKDQAKHNIECLIIGRRKGFFDEFVYLVQPVDDPECLGAAILNYHDRTEGVLECTTVRYWGQKASSDKEAAFSNASAALGF